MDGGIWRQIRELQRQTEEQVDVLAGARSKLSGDRPEGLPEGASADRNAHGKPNESLADATTPPPKLQLSAMEEVPSEGPADVAIPPLEPQTVAVDAVHDGSRA